MPSFAVQADWPEVVVPGLRTQRGDHAIHLDLLVESGSIFLQSRNMPLRPAEILLLFIWLEATGSPFRLRHRILLA